MKSFFRKILRAIVYPMYNIAYTLYAKHVFKHWSIKPDLWLASQRGNDYWRHRRRVNGYMSIRGKTVLVAGCGSGNDIPSWLAFKPNKLIGIDLFRYEQEWRELESEARKRHMQTSLEFIQSDLSIMKDIGTSTIDIVASDAVFEHVIDLGNVLKEFNRILAPGGLVYATFGPLWFAYGGDHVSGFDSLESGYNHLILNSTEYNQYLDCMGPYRHSEHDGRTWIYTNLFSKLTPSEYLALLDSTGFERLFVSAIIDKRAREVLRSSKNGKTLRRIYPEEDLRITGLTIIYRKK